MVESGSWAELSDGDEFAGYRIERRIGRGGMGILYLAVEPGLDRRVALKLIAPEAAADEVFAKRFAEESRIAASIEHPNVVPIYAAGEERGIPYIAMRFVSGSDLGRRIAREGRLEPAHAAALIAQVANGLDAIHAAGLVHRDVKPANVLLSGEEGEEHAYITDFGVARNVATQSGLTQTGRFVGTLDYVAPEQISGAGIDARVDVYALGCLLFKLLTGEVPFPRDGEAARLYAHLNDPPPSPSLYVPAVPMALDDVVVRAMSKLPEDRYPSAGDLGRAAVAAMSGTSVTIPERTVATGAAATVESDLIEPPRPAEPESPTETRQPPPTGESDRLDSDLEHAPAGPRSNAAKSDRRRLLLGGGAALAVAVVLAIVLLSGGGGGRGASATSAENTTPAESVSGEKRHGGGGGQAKQTPPPLTKPELIKKGDEICAQSRATYTGYLEEFPNGKFETGVGFSKLLVGISGKAVRRFNDLKPPASLAESYAAYVAAQEEVAQWDRDALKAAEAGDKTAELTAREDNFNTEEERQAMAEAIGFHECSGSEA
jgi:serine/threonine protein kinase